MISYTTVGSAGMMSMALDVRASDLVLSLCCTVQTMRTLQLRKVPFHFMEICNVMELCFSEQISYVELHNRSSITRIVSCCYTLLHVHTAARNYCHSGIVGL